MKEQYGCGFLFVGVLYLVFAILTGGLTTFIIQFLVFRLCDYCGGYLGEYLFVLAVDITLFVSIALLLLWVWYRDFEGYGNRILALLAFLIACGGAIVVGNNLFHDFAMMFPNARDFDKDAIEMGNFILWFEMAELGILAGFAVLSGGVLLSRPQEKRKVEELS